MKKNGVLNDRISQLIAEMGHKEELMICDAGMPIPRECNRIDVSLTAGVPTFIQTLQTVLQELCIERVILAEEIREHNGSLNEELQRIFDSTPIEYKSHQEMKDSMLGTKGVIRSGEFSPFANVRLVSGVVF